MKNMLLKATLVALCTVGVDASATTKEPKAQPTIPALSFQEIKRRAGDVWKAVQGKFAPAAVAKEARGDFGVLGLLLGISNLMKEISQIPGATFEIHMLPQITAEFKRVQTEAADKANQVQPELRASLQKVIDQVKIAMSKDEVRKPLAKILIVPEANVDETLVIALVGHLQDRLPANLLERVMKILSHQHFPSVMALFGRLLEQALNELPAALQQDLEVLRTQVETLAKEQGLAS